MEFWRIAFQFGWVSADELRGAVKTDTRINGEITPEQFKEITKEDFIKVEKPVEVPVAPQVNNPS